MNFIMIAKLKMVEAKLILLKLSFILLLISSVKVFSQVVFSTPGTFTWTVPPCVTQITVQVWAGGGGGGSVWSRFDPTSNSLTSDEACVTAGGGGGGGFVSRVYTVVPGQVYTVTVGAGGNGGPLNATGNNRANNGLPGGNSTFSGPATVAPGTLTAFGGSGGGAANFLRNCLGGCSGAVHQGANGAGGTGGAGANGTTTFAGGNGSAGNHSGSTNDRSGSGGGGAGATANGGNAASTTGGSGGANGGGNGGNGIVQPFGNGYLGTNGNVGNTIGGGGGGASGHNRASTNNSHRTNTGGNGARGEIRINFTTPALPEPLFSSVAPICSGGTLNPLPTTSNNGFNGTWSPALNTTSTTTYTFTPDPSGPCADTTSLTILVNQPTTPSFSSVNPICVGATPNPLPITSNNGINGSWSPALNSTSTTTYTFTPNQGECATNQTLIITVNNPITPTFNSPNSACLGSTINPLPTTSTNGVTGSWTPSINTTSTTTYTFTPTAGQCANNATFTIAINNPVTPQFNSIPPICVGDPLSPLPTNSLNGITGSWSPSLNNTTTTTYTFNPSSGQCATTTTLTITVNQTSITPTFSSISPTCSGSNLAALPTISLEGINGTWSPALNNTATTTYTFTPNAGQCATSTTITISIVSPTVPLFSSVNPVCSGTILNPLPVNSNNGINGAWQPPLNNTSTTTYTFTPSTGQCASTQTLTININSPINPTFSPVAPVCFGDNINALPNLSNNGINGNWSPAINTTSSTTYTFTPNSGQCATTTTLSISINTPVTPNFSSVSSACVGDNINPLPLVSANGISGAWSPVINNQFTTTYTFTPTAGQCATTNTLTIIVNLPITPSFTQVAPICAGDVISPLPNVSNNGISGSWNPLPNNSSSTTYTFTPANGQCANQTTMTIAVNSPVAAVFSAIPPICSGNTLNPLPATSNNGIQGNWTPAVNNISTTTYSFTPNSGQCGLGTSLTITVNSNPVLLITNPNPVCSPATVDVTSATVTTGSSPGTLSYWTNSTATSALVNPSNVSQGSVYFIQLTSANGCQSVQSVTVTINESPDLMISDPAPVCFPGVVNLTSASVTSGSTGNGNLSYWQDANATLPLNAPQSVSTSGVYYIQSTTAAGCTDIATVNVLILQAPIPLISADTLSGCAPICVNFSNLTTGNVSSLTWIIGNEATSNQSNPTHCFSSVGLQNVTLTVTGTNGCTATSAPLVINLFPSPTAAFLTSSNTISLMEGGNIVSYFNQSSPDVASWYWNFGNGDTLAPDQPNPIYDYSETNGGSFTTTLTVYNSFGCSDVTSTEIIVEPYFTFYVPNAFTPNNDGLNDTFSGVGIGIIDYEILIFDRWGELIYEANDIQNGWDGKAKGGDEVVQQDVYVWKINIKDIFNIKHEYAGRVSLVK